MLDDDTLADLDVEAGGTPITVNETSVSDQAGALGRDFLLLLGVVPALIAVLGTRDVGKIVAYISGVEFAPALGIIMVTGVTVWRQFRARRVHAKQKAMAERLPNSIARLK